MNHGLLYVRLRRNEFMAHRVPFATFCQLGQTCAVSRDTIGDAQSLRLSNEITPEVFDAVLLFARDEEKAVGDQAAEHEGYLLPACVSWSRIVAPERIAREWFKFVQLLKNARNGWRSVSIHAEFLALVTLVSDAFLLGVKRREVPGCKRDKDQRNESDRGERQMRS